MIVTIHQPNFMPWWPFFQKAMAADLIILMTHCQYEKGGYQNRFQLDGKWHTMSVAHGLQPIREKAYLDPQADWDAIKEALPQYRELLSEFDCNIHHNLADTNIAIIRAIMRKFGGRTAIAYDHKAGLKGTDRLLDLCHSYGATQYLSGPSGRSYLDTSKFERAGIGVQFFGTSSKQHTLEVLSASAV